jgi:hypothetical protein
VTPDQAKTLKYFKWDELRHPTLCDYQFWVFLDQVRAAYGKPLVVTDDARTPDEKPSGYSPTSLHYKGRAADLRFPSSAADLFALVSAAIRVANGRPLEVELVNGSGDKHVHLGLFDDPAHPSTCLVTAD